MAEQKSADSVSSFRVTYYPFGGRAEPIMLAATLGGISFERKVINQADWPPYKKAGNAVWSGPPEVTLLDKDGNDVATIAQSNSCVRLVGSLAGLYPSNLLERARVDGFLDTCEDLNGLYMKYAFAPKDEKAAVAAKLCEQYPYWFGKLEQQLEQNEKRGNGNGYFVGNSLTIADLKSFSTLAGLSAIPGIADLFEKYARLNAYFNRMSADADIKAAQAKYQVDFDAFKADNKQNLFKYAGKAVFVGEPTAKRILMVVTNTAEFKKGDETVQTGFYIPEIAHPYAVFKAAGYAMTYVSPLGGDAPCDPSSIAGFKDDAECKAFQADVMGGKTSLATVKIEDVKDAAAYDVIFYVGGVGVMWDFPDYKVASSVATAIYEAGGLVGGVCHGPAGLLSINLSNGKPLVEGKTVTGFTNEEEAASGLTETVPLLLETALKAKGAQFTSVKTWGANVEVSERVLTGQNPASASGVAKAIVAALN